MSEDYIIQPGETFEPGDVFEAIPFPTLKHPAPYYRRKKQTSKTAPEFYGIGDKEPIKDGDIIHSNVQLKAVMVLSHGCEMDKVLELKSSADRRPWLCAPLLKLPEIPADADIGQIKGDQEKQNAKRVLRIREGNQPNRFFIPQSQFLDGEQCVDLRRITPIPAAYFMQAKKLCSLSSEARDELYAQLGVNFSGLALYLTAMRVRSVGPKSTLMPLLWPRRTILTRTLIRVDLCVSI